MIELNLHGSSVPYPKVRQTRFDKIGKNCGGCQEVA